MARFETEKDAKEYLVRRIVAEAEHEGTPLTNVERKMLYFTESGWTLPDIMDVNAEFERDYDNDTYEQKIAGLAGSLKKRDSESGGDTKAAWDEAVEKLSEGDHYLLVLINPRLVSVGGLKRPPRDFLKLVLIALACVIGLLALMTLYGHFFPK